MRPAVRRAQLRTSYNWVRLKSKLRVEVGLIWLKANPKPSRGRRCTPLLQCGEARIEPDRACCGQAMARKGSSLGLSAPRLDPRGPLPHSRRLISVYLSQSTLFPNLDRTVLIHHSTPFRMRPLACLTRPALAGLGRVGPQPGPSQPNSQLLAHSFANLALISRRPHLTHPSARQRLLSTSAVRHGGPGSGRKKKVTVIVVEEEADDAAPTESVVGDEAAGEEEAADDVLPGSSTFRLRPYQLDCVEAVLQALRDGYTRIGVSAPTGKHLLALCQLIFCG